MPGEMLRKQALEPLTLGVDVSTQSISAAVVDIESGKAIFDISIPYREDPRTNCFGISFANLLVPPRVPGEADQPPLMFLAALDALFSDLTASGIDLGLIRAVAVSAQQHGHVYLHENADRAYSSLTNTVDGKHAMADLATRFADAFSYGTAPIWQTSNTSAQADYLTSAVGGRANMLEITGSDSPLRFSGAVMRRVCQEHPKAWSQTKRIHLLSSFISGVLTGRADCPIDWGNGSGMSLMDYRKKQWSPSLTQAVSSASPQSPDLRDMLPQLASPIELAGNIAPYFSRKYGFSPDCVVSVGSGDNPQSKVMSSGDILSLGTSFVLMVNTNSPVIDPNGFANSMYDGLGRPFVFACRTNGALVLEQLRHKFHVYDDWQRTSTALRDTTPGERTVVWQPYSESYPSAAPMLSAELETAFETGSDFAQWYAALVDSTLVLTWAFAKSFDPRWSGSDQALAITGGPTADRQIARRIAAIWRRPVKPVAAGGAAVGSAMSAYAALLASTGKAADIDDEMTRIENTLLPSAAVVDPDPELVHAFHDDGAIEHILTIFQSLNLSSASTK